MNQVDVELILAAAFVNAVISDVAALFKAATEANPINAATNAYSTRSCPISSRHNVFRIVRITVLPAIFIIPCVAR
jgi:hypothetical protein